MKKPHEQYLTAEPAEHPRKGDTWLYTGVDEPVAIVLGDAGPQWAAFLKAAPKMTRALLRVAEESADVSVDGLPCYCLPANRKAMRRAVGEPMRHEEWCEEARAALREAGVLP